MEVNDKKIRRTRTIINFVVSFFLAIFLILLSNTIIGDLDSTVKYPNRSDFEDSAVELKYDNDRNVIQKQIDIHYESQSNIRKMIETAQTNKNAEQQSFDNWIKTRSTLGSPSQDPEVLKRLNKLDEYQAVVQSWQAKSDSINNLITELRKKESELRAEYSTVNAEVSERYYAAINTYDLRVFLVRLLFTAPILALGIFFFIRKRNHKFAPLFLGFGWFSLYVFFFGLVPYLPHYGGYVRYTVGVLLTLGLGYYAIKKLREYSDKKKAELKVSTEERAGKLQIDTAEKAYMNHICPSCGKDFLLKNWEKMPSTDLKSMKLASNYCRFCGMLLMKECPKCKQENYAHLPFCIKCGENLKD